MSIGDKFNDSIAFARCVMRQDWAGIESLLDLNPDPLDIMIPQAWILNAAIGRLAHELDVSVDDMWMVMMESVMEVAKEMDEVMKDEDDGEQ